MVTAISISDRLNVIMTVSAGRLRNVDTVAGGKRRGKLFLSGILYVLSARRLIG